MIDRLWEPSVPLRHASSDDPETPRQPSGALAAPGLGLAYVSYDTTPHLGEQVQSLCIRKVDKWDRRVLVHAAGRNREVSVKGSNQRCSTLVVLQDGPVLERPEVEPELPGPGIGGEERVEGPERVKVPGERW